MLVIFMSMKKTNEHKSAHLVIRVTQTQIHRIKAKIDQEQITISEFIRKLIDDKLKTSKSQL